MTKKQGLLLALALSVLALVLSFVAYQSQNPHKLTQDEIDARYDDSVLTVVHTISKCSVAYKLYEDLNGHFNNWKDSRTLFHYEENGLFVYKTSDTLYERISIDGHGQVSLCIITGQFDSISKYSTFQYGGIIFLKLKGQTPATIGDIICDDFWMLSGGIYKDSLYETGSKIYVTHFNKNECLLLTNVIAQKMYDRNVRKQLVKDSLYKIQVIQQHKKDSLNVLINERTKDSITAQILKCN